MKPFAVAVLVAVGLAGCGSSHTSRPATATNPSPPAAAPTASTKTASASPSAPSALQAEAKSAATGDIPDNQVFLTFRDAGAGYSMKYPEGWAQQGSGSKIAFRDKNNVVRVVVLHAAPPTLASVRSRLAGAQVVAPPKRLTLAGAPGWKVSYSTQSAPNPVTGKRVTLLVDRYYVARGGKEAIVDLGTPKGVDNVDAYRLMIESFRWR